MILKKIVFLFFTLFFQRFFRGKKKLKNIGKKKTVMFHFDFFFFNFLKNTFLGGKGNKKAGPKKNIEKKKFY